jgi:hypothetical protein
MESFMKRILIMYSVISILIGCTGEDSKESEVKQKAQSKDKNEQEVVAKETTEQEQQEQKIEVEQVTEEEKEMFRNSLYTHLEALAYTVEEQIKVYTVRVLVNGLTPVKREDVDATNRMMVDISYRLNLIRNLEVPKDSKINTEYNSFLLLVDKLYIALQKGQEPFRNNQYQQLNALLIDEIHPIKQDFYNKIGFSGTTQPVEVQDEDKINEEAYDTNVPLDEQREEIYGEMECSPPTYCDGD